MAGSRLAVHALALALATSVLAGPSYLGPSTCSSTSCHGSTTPRTEFRIPQDEYTKWSGVSGHPDKHRRAWQVLAEPLGQRIARNLGIAKATEAKQCLACHEPPVADRSEKFAVGEGVSCEHCHGPAAGWIDSHAKGASHADNVARGLVDMKDMAQRTAQCLKCHLGAEDRRVDHALIAAGHPDLTFEIDTFTEAMPPHFKVEREATTHLKNWALGQAQHLKSQMEYLATISTGSQWPDYARLDCAACHHPLQTPQNQWRLKQDKHGRAPGRPPFNTAQHAAFKHLARAVAPKDAAELERAVAAVYATLSTNSPGRGATAAAATRAAGEAAQMLAKVRTATYDFKLACKLILEVARDATGIADQGPRAGLQTVWLLDLLVRLPRHGSSGPMPSELKGQISDLYRQADLVSEFNAPHFAHDLQRFSAWAERMSRLKDQQQH